MFELVRIVNAINATDLFSVFQIVLELVRIVNAINATDSIDYQFIITIIINVIILIMTCLVDLRWCLSLLG